MDETPAIELRGLGRDFGPTRALDEVSLRVERGEIFGYLGPNGAGKTTTLKVLAGLVRPSRGDAFVCGHSVTARALEAKARLGYLPESGALFERLTPREHLVAVGQLYRLRAKDAAERAARWLEELGLRASADLPIGTLSKGTRQRVCWATALLHDPEVLVLDEPLGGLDVEAVAQVKDLLRRLAAEGRTVFYSSHLADVVERMCTRLGVLFRGRLVFVGTPEDLRERAAAGSLEEALVRLWQAEQSRLP